MAHETPAMGRTMKVRIIKVGKKHPQYLLSTNIESRNGRLAELDDEGSYNQATLKSLFDASRPPSREHRHDRFAQAAFIKLLRGMGCTWGEIGAKIDRSGHAAQTLYQRYYEKKCPVCNANSMKKVKAKPGHMAHWECTNGGCKTNPG